MSSRRRSASTATANTPQMMGPPPDRDVVMGPPPIPLSAPPQQKPKDSQDITEKYRKLKRRYFELEEKQKEIASELQRSGERNVKMRDERNVLLDRIIELESQVKTPNGGPLQPLQPPASAFPRSLLSARARTSFVSNLRTAMSEEDIPPGQEDIDPLLTSRHIGPLARKREEEERRERIEEEARESRRSARRGRVTQQAPPPPPQPGKTEYSGPPLPPPGGPATSPPVLVSSGGTRLKIKPPAPPAPESMGVGHPAGLSPPIGHQMALQQPRSQSPVSPMVSTHDGGYAPPAPFRGNGASTSMPMQSVNIHASPSQQHPPPPLPHQQSQQRSPSPGPVSPTQWERRIGATERYLTKEEKEKYLRSGKPKRLKAHTVTSRSFSIPTVPRDKRGRPMLPLNVGIMTVISLGEVCMREHFHTERYIFPVGYEVTRRYSSTIDASSEVVYHCTILDGGDGPKFQIVPSDVPDRPVIAGTATGAWSNIVKQANHIRNRQHSNSVSGPDFFGLGQNTIKHLIQELPGADRLRDYVWQNFVEGGPLGGRHAAVIPALPEEYDSAVPIGAYYPNEREMRAKREAEEGQELLRLSGQERLQILQQKQQLQPQPGRLQDPQPQPNITTIVLPPPTSSDSLNIQEYQPPPAEHRNSRPRASSTSSTPNEQFEPVHRTRSTSRSHPQQSPIYTQPPPPPPPGQAHQSPYLTNAPSPPPVPPTFASIMNAYPAPAPASNSAGSPRSGSDSAPLSGKSD